MAAALQIVEFPKPQAPLYELIDHLGALLDSAEVVPDEQREAFEADLRRYVAALLDKVDDVCGYFAHLETQAHSAAAEIRRLEARKATNENRFERLKQYVIRVMDSQGVKKLEGRTNTLRLQGIASAVEITDESAVPLEFKSEKTELSIDRRAVKIAMQSLEDVPGARLLTGRKTLVRS